MNVSLPRTFQPEALTGTVLLVSPFAEDHRTLYEIFSEHDWKLDGVNRVQEAIRWIARCGPPPILICEKVLPDGGWKDLLHHIEELPRRSRLIVTSRLADDHLWCEVLNLLGDDVLSKPFEANEVTYVVTCAWESWRRQSPKQQVELAISRASGN